MVGVKIGSLTPAPQPAPCERCCRIAPEAFLFGAGEGGPSFVVCSPSGLDLHARGKHTRAMSNQHKRAGAR